MSEEWLEAFKKLIRLAYENGRAGTSDAYIRQSTAEWCALYEGDPERQEIGRRCEKVLLEAHQRGRKEAAQCPHTS